MKVISTLPSGLLPQRIAFTNCASVHLPSPVSGSEVWCGNRKKKFSVV
jgi:hypothetical protein